MSDIFSFGNGIIHGDFSGNLYTSGNIVASGGLSTLGAVTFSGYTPITTNDTGNFYTRDNPSGYLTAASNGITTGDADSRYYGGIFNKDWSRFVNGNAGSLTYTTDVNAPMGTGVFQLNTFVWAIGPIIPLDKTQNYEIEYWVKKVSGTGAGALYLAAREWDTNLSGINGDGTEWAYPSPYSFYPQTSLVTGVWTKFNGIVGPNSGAYKDHSSSGKFISVGFIANYNNPTSLDTLQFAGFKCKPILNTGNLASTSNLASTGSNLLSQINTIKNWTGITNTLYYPSGSNPSNYITSSQTGIFADAGKTGIFITTGQTGSYSNSFYPLNSNPSNYIANTQTGNFIDKGQTGQFYAASNPNQYISTGNGDVRYALSSQTGSFITTGQTGTFGGSSNTGQLTGAFYPLNSNPSNYVLASATGNNVQTTDTRALNLGQITATSISCSNIIDSTTRTLLTGNGLATLDWNKKLLTGAWDSQGLSVSGNNVVTTNQTGQFYPNSNPNQYISTGNADGRYYAISNPNSYISTGNADGRYSSLKVTGSTLVTAPNFSGIGGTNVILSGSFVLVSGGTSAGGGLTTCSNLGAGSGLFTSVSSTTAQFKSLVTGETTIIQGDANTLRYEVSLPTGTNQSTGAINETSGNTWYQVAILTLGVGSFYLNGHITIGAAANTNFASVGRIYNSTDDKVLASAWQTCVNPSSSLYTDSGIITMSMNAFLKANVTKTIVLQVNSNTPGTIVIYDLSNNNGFTNIGTGAAGTLSQLNALQVGF